MVPSYGGYAKKWLIRGWYYAEVLRCVIESGVEEGYEMVNSWHKPHPGLGHVKP